MRSKFKCLDCGVDTGKIGEHYMLKDKVWRAVHDSPKGMLCVGCLEKRLRRPLTRQDFNDSHVNKPAQSKFFSLRLSARLEL